MKHLFKLALMGAAVLAAASCHRESAEDRVDNPNDNPQTREVVTNFVLNIATKTQTKMSADAVQADVNAAVNPTPFRGLDDAKLMAYAMEGASYKGILPSDATADKLYDLAHLASAAQLSGEENRRILELSLPLKTNTLLFYGRAPYGDPYGGYSVKNCYGSLGTYTITADVNSTNFTAGVRLPVGEDYNKFMIMERIFAGIQSMLLNTTLSSGLHINANDSPAGVANKYANDVTLTSAIKWEYYDNVDGESPLSGAPLYPLEVKLANLYKQITTIRGTDGELRAGSGEAILRMGQDLMSVLNEIRCAAPLREEETVAKYFANVVYERMNKYFTASTNNTGAPITDVHFQNQTSLFNAFFSSEEVATRPYAPTSETYWPSEAQFQSISSLDPEEFPANFDLPRGATHIVFDTTTKLFSYPQTFNVSGMSGAGVAGSDQTYNATSYLYPAELLYFGNSPIRTSDVDHKAGDYPKGSDKWVLESEWEGTEKGWTGNTVKASTRSVAMKHNINYGVAVLRTEVKFDPAEGNLIYDNNHAVQAENGRAVLADLTDEPDNGLVVSSGMFKVTGIIIGGQPLKIGWDHLPVKIDDSYKYGFMYDQAIPASAQSIPETGTSGYNYTLVYDNFLAHDQVDGIYTPEETQSSVSVAIEFRNDSGKDFYGNHNLIRNGGYFYLIGLLNPASATNFDSITWPSDHVVPPYNADGTSQEKPRVFIQDFMTKATFKIGPQSLHGAYLTVPDLRSTSMTLGLSVDLEWENGLEFEDVLLGN